MDRQAAVIDKNTCFICHGFGHYARSCTSLPSIYLHEDAPRCYNCKGFGHYARCCPNWLVRGGIQLSSLVSTSFVDRKKQRISNGQMEMLNQALLLQWYESHYLDPLTGGFIPCAPPYDMTISMTTTTEEKPRTFKVNNNNNDSENDNDNVAFITSNDNNGIITKLEEYDSEDATPEHDTIISVN